MEFAIFIVPLYVMHRLLPFACATCIGIACYVVAKRYTASSGHSRIAATLHKILRSLRFHCESQSFSPEELCPVSTIYQNAEAHTLLLTPEMHSEVAAIVDSIVQGFITPWFEELSPADEFPHHIEGILEDTFLELTHKLTFIHPARALQLCLETSYMHLQHLPRCQQSSEALGPDHPAAVDRLSEWHYLESLTTCALRLVEPADLLSAKVTHTLVVQLICRDVFLPLVDLISKPGVIYYLLVMLCTKSPLQDDTNTENSSIPSVAEEISGPIEFPQSHSVGDLEKMLNMQSPVLRSPRSSPLRHAVTSSDIERAVEADGYNNSASLHKVNITRTEARSEHGKGVYTVYCIEYQPRLAGRIYSAKRRFNEFLNLQSSLNKICKFDPALRSIKGPSRWLANPFINDKKSVANRRIYLQNYLRQLVDIKEVVKTIQFQMFMGAIGDPNVLFTGGMNTLLNPLRIDRMLAEGVRGALDLFKTAMPNDVPKNSATFAENYHHYAPQMFEGHSNNIELAFDVNTSGRKLRQAVFSYIDNFDFASSPEFSPVHSQTPNPSSKPESEEMQEYFDQKHFPNDSSNATIIQSACSNPLMKSILDVFSIVMEGHNSSQIAGMLSKLETIVGGFTEELLSDKLEEIFSPHNCATLLHRLHVLITKLAQGSDMTPNERSLEEAHKALRELFPLWALNYFPVDEFILNVLQSVKEERFNRALVYKLADALLYLLASTDNIEAWTR